MPYAVFSAETEISLAQEHANYSDPGSALAAIENAQVSEVFLCDSRLLHGGTPELPDDLDRYDLLHSGLSLGARGKLGSLWLTNTNWFFLDPPADQRCISWKATPAFCWLRPDVVRALGGFDRAYRSGDMQLMDMAYRILAAGGRVCHQPFQQKRVEIDALEPLISMEDELIFIFRHLGQKAALYATAWMGVMTLKPFRLIRTFRNAARKVRKVPAPRPLASTKKWHLLSGTKRQTVGKISAIIPTLNRYEYLPQAIDSLLRLTPSPEEILVVDQTPFANRQMDVYDAYRDNDKVRVIFLNEAGQSIARNTAIREARSEWCLLFEDDTVAWEGFMAEHIRLVEYSGAAASTGVSLAPWKTVEHIPPRIRLIRIADVLATGNCLVRKDALLAVGGLDRAFDRGSGADSDLGLRLYLQGYETITNPNAVQTHYKAPKGGMRTYGAWWRNHATLWGPYPQPTQVYSIQRYYPKSYWLPLYFLYFLHARQQLKLGEFVWLWISLPWKLSSAIRHAALLQHQLISDY